MEITTWSIKIYFAGMFIFGAQIACQQTFLALGRAKIFFILSTFKKSSSFSSINIYTSKLYGKWTFRCSFSRACC